jgi:hypothetical protein
VLYITENISSVAICNIRARCYPPVYKLGTKPSSGSSPPRAVERVHAIKRVADIMAPIDTVAALPFYTSITTTQRCRACISCTYVESLRSRWPKHGKWKSSKDAFYLECTPVGESNQQLLRDGLNGCACACILSSLTCWVLDRLMHTLSFRHSFPAKPGGFKAWGAIRAIRCNSGNSGLDLSADNVKRFCSSASQV